MYIVQSKEKDYAVLFISSNRWFLEELQTVKYSIGKYLAARSATKSRPVIPVCDLE